MQRGNKRSQVWRVFGLGLGIRLAGVALIWSGDGSVLWWRRALVVLGVALSIGGIGLLRFLLLSGPLARLTAKRTP